MKRLALVVTVAATTLAVYAGAAPAKPSPLEICADITYPPMTFIQNGKPTGVDVDLATLLAKKIGRTPHFNQTGFAGIIAALQAGKCDIIMNGMNDTPARRKQVDYVDYLEENQTFMVRTGNPQHITSVASLSGKTVGVALGSTNYLYLKQQSARLKKHGKKPIDVQTFPKDPDAVNSLLTNKLDAYFADSSVVAYYVGKAPQSFALTNVAVHPVPDGIALRKNEGKLRRQLQKGITQLYKSGQAQKILLRWHLGRQNFLPKYR